MGETMKARQVTKLFMGLVAISFLNVACQGNLQTDSQLKSASNGQALSTPEELTSKVDMKAVEDSVAQSKVAMTEAQAILAKFSNPDGSIKLLSLLTSSSSSVQSESIFIIYEKLSEVLNKIVVKVGEAKGKFAGVRAQLAVELSKLDPANPAHAAVLQQIGLMMAQIDKAESQFSVVIGQLADKLSLVNRGIDALTAGASGLFPGAGIIVGMLTNQVKQAITEFQTKLKAL